MTHAGKMPALQKGVGLNAVRESGSAGVSKGSEPMPPKQRCPVMGLGLGLGRFPTTRLAAETKNKKSYAGTTQAKSESFWKKMDDFVHH